MSRWPSFIVNQVELGLYDFVYPGEVPSNEGQIEATYETLDIHSPNRSLIEEVQGQRLTRIRFERGENCFMAIHQGHVVSYIWGSRGKVGVEEITMAVKTAPTEMYLYDAFTLEPWRGKNLYPSVLQRALEFGRDLDLTRSTIFVEARNTPSIRGVTKAGFILFQTLLLKTILGFGKPKLLPPLEGHPPAEFVPL
ncbi:GNAT family N-acetyltransferase [Nitrospinota bacterium]